MPQRSTRAFLLPIILLATLGACKYEEGPLVSLRSKRERVVNDWRVEKIVEADGKERENVDESWSFTEDGKVLFNGNQNGEWSFGSDKETLILDPKAGPEEEFEILRLKEQELWLENGNSDEIRFVAS